MTFRAWLAGLLPGHRPSLGELEAADALNHGREPTTPVFLIAR